VNTNSPNPQQFAEIQPEDSLLFHKWLDELMLLLNLTNVEVAQLGGIDPSLVSRFRRGVRRPSANLKQLKHLVKGLFLAAQRNNQLDDLTVFLGDYGDSEVILEGPESISEYIEHPLYSRLFETAVAVLEESPRLPKGTKDELSSLNCVPGRLTRLMTFFSVTNSHLAHELKVDNSLVSRWRSGSRPLRADNPMLSDIATYFANLICLQSEGNDEDSPFYTSLQNLLSENGVTPSNNVIVSKITSLGQAGLAELLRQWLLSDLLPEEEGTDRIRRMLKKVDTWDGLPLFDDELTTEIINVPQTVHRGTYQGVVGIRRAVVRFLSDVALSSHKRHIKLFSNQVMDWLVGDQTFLRVWSCLMYLVLVRGHKIEIIHNLGRSDSEIGVAIENWLPLYLNGTIRSYTCSGLNRREGPAMPLVSTLFVDVGHAAIRGEFIQGLEDEAIYRYYQGEKSVRAMERQFDQLRQMSEPLLQVFQDSQEIHERVISLFRAAADASTGRVPLCDAFVSLPLYLLPADVLNDVLREHKLSATDCERVKSKYQNSREALDELLQNGQLQLSFPRHWIPFKEGEMSQQSLTTEQIDWEKVQRLDMFTENKIEDHFWSKNECAPSLETGLKNIGLLTLSREHYRRFLLSLRELMIEYPSLLLRPIVDNPYGHLRILSQSGRSLLIIKRQPVGLMLECTNVTICHNFEQYFYQMD
jgi:transcriptional regulator with XRE-family HTH domain